MQTLEARVGTNQTDISEGSTAFTGKEEAQAQPWGLACSILGERGGWCGHSEPCSPPESGSGRHSVTSDSSPPHGQAPLFVEIFRQEYWSELPFPLPAQGLISCIGRQALYHQDHLGSPESGAKGQRRQSQVIGVQTSGTFKQNEKQRVTESDTCKDGADAPSRTARRRPA